MATNKKRGRKSGPDKNKIELILRILRSNPQGIWVRELSRLTDLKRSTISLYINTHLANKIEDVHDKVLPMRLIKLKKNSSKKYSEKKPSKEIPEYIG